MGSDPANEVGLSGARGRLQLVHGAPEPGGTSDRPGHASLQLSDCGLEGAERDRAGDRELVQGLRVGAAWAHAELFDRYADDVRRMLLRVLGMDAELADLIQDVFLRVLEGVDRIEDPQRLRGWIAAICVNTARERIRRRRRRWWLVLVGHGEVLETECVQPEEQHGDELMRATYRVLDQMDSEDRIILTLRLFEGMELMEVATACGVSKATIKRRIARGMERFRRLARSEPMLQDYAQAGGP